MRVYCGLKECGRGYMFLVGLNKFLYLEDREDKWLVDLNRVCMDRYWLFRIDLFHGKGLVSSELVSF